MKRIYLTVIGFIILTLPALAAPSAFAEEKSKMLPESGVTYVGTQGEGRWTTGRDEISCLNASSSGTIESANSGRFKLLFKECKQSCTTNGSTLGHIEINGTYRFWLALETLNGTPETLVGALVFLPEEAHFTCNRFGFSELVLLRGCWAGLATMLNTLVSHTHATFSEVAGVQLIILVLEPGAIKEVECIQLLSFDGGSFEQAAFANVTSYEQFKKGETAVTVLLMNPEAHE